MIRVLKNLFGGGWIILLVLSGPSLYDYSYYRNNLERTDKENYAFLQFFRKKEEGLKIRISVPPPPPPPGFENNPYSPNTISPDTPDPKITTPGLPERRLQVEPSPWQWF